MKIGFDAKRYFFNRTGLGDYSRNLIGHLHRLHPEFQIHLFTPKLSDLTVDNGIHVHVPERSRFLYRQFGMAKDIAISGVNIFHGLSAELPQNLHNKKISRVVTIHDLLFLKFPNYYAPLDRKIYQWKTKKACQSADAVITISDATARELQAHFQIDSKKIHIIPPIASFRPALNHSISRSGHQGKPVLLCVSSFTKRKNLERLIDAFVNANTGFRLVIAGKSGETRRLMERKTQHIPISDIELLFDVRDSVLKQLWSEASAFIYPSEAEGFGMPVLDALHFRLPVITSIGTSMQEIAGSAGVYFEAGNTDSMRNAIDYTWEHLSEFAEGAFQQNINERLALFTAEKSTESLVTLYRSM